MEEYAKLVAQILLILLNLRRHDVDKITCREIGLEVEIDGLEMLHTCINITVSNETCNPPQTQNCGGASLSRK